MDQKDVKKRDVMGFDKFSEAWDTVRKIVMLKKGQNANPAASEIKGEPLFSRNDANPYVAMQIPHDEATANINRNVLPGMKVMVQDTKHDGKDQPDGNGNIDPTTIKDMDKEREKESKAASKDIPKQIHEEKFIMEFSKFDDLYEAAKKEQTDAERVATEIATHVIEDDSKNETSVLIDEDDEVKDMAFFHPIEQWLKNNWEKLNKMNDQERETFFNYVEETFGKKTADIIDSAPSSDYLHYNQRGVVGGNSGVTEFISNFNNIKAAIDKKLETVK